MVCEIGKGAFGSVYKIRDKTTRSLYAAKHLENIPSNKTEVRRVLVGEFEIINLIDLCKDHT